MYSTCLFCHNDLGRNELFEAFPVGRHLAFDANHGRLWVICGSCRRWNLSPLESRWEAIEQCDRLFRSLTIRAATDEIALARTGDGGSLVRLGKPKRAEFVGWRYGRMLSWRRVRRAALVGVGLTGLGTVGVVAAASVAADIQTFVGILWGLGLNIGVHAGRLVINGLPSTVVARIAVDGSAVRVRREDLERIRLTYDERVKDYRLVLHHTKGVTMLHGAPARFALGRVLPAMNHTGADQRDLDDATSLIDRAPSTEVYLRDTFRFAGRRANESITGMPDAMRLAFEIALLEESERLAMESELQELADAWRDAEEVAAIADNLLIPDVVHRQWRALRGRLD